MARRHGALPNGRPGKAVQFMAEFKVMYEAENVHPLEGGIVRLKFRKDRRRDRPIEPVGVFHLKLAAEFARKLWIYGSRTWRAWRIASKVINDPKRREYMDVALTPVAADDFEKLAMFHDTAGGEAAVAKRRGEDQARERVAAARIKIEAAE